MTKVEVYIGKTSCNFALSAWNLLMIRSNFLFSESAQYSGFAMSFLALIFNHEKESPLRILVLLSGTEALVRSNSITPDLANSEFITGEHRIYSWSTFAAILA
jgi:hypothetical protein